MLVLAGNAIISNCQRFHVFHDSPSLGNLPALRDRELPKLIGRHGQVLIHLVELLAIDWGASAELVLIEWVARQFALV